MLFSINMLFQFKSLRLQKQGAEIEASTQHRGSCKFWVATVTGANDNLRIRAKF